MVKLEYTMNLTLCIIQFTSHYKNHMVKLEYTMNLTLCIIQFTSHYKNHILIFSSKPKKDINVEFRILKQKNCHIYGHIPIVVESL